MAVSDPSKKFSLALGSQKGPTATNGIKRPHAALRDHDSEDEEDNGRAQKVSHFDRKAGGAIDESRPKVNKAPLVIAPQKNRDWREASQRKRQQHGGAAEENGAAIAEVEARENDKIYGLNIRKRPEEAPEPADENETSTAQDQQPATEVSDDVPPVPKTADDRAMDALLGKTPKSTLTIPSQQVSETDAFRDSYTTAPDTPDLDAYARIPVEEFGAAMLRGMGWKDGEGVGTEKGKSTGKAKIPQRRAALLGIGAKEEAAVAGEMGAWGRGARGGKEVKVYNPILLRDKKTGELFTEEELQKKKEKDEKDRIDAEFEAKESRREKDHRSSRYEDEECREKRREKDTRRDRDHGDRYRDSEKDKERRRRRDDSDEEYYRVKKEKERMRRDREREDVDYERNRDRRHESRRDERDRHGDRHRDRERGGGRDRRR